MLKRGMMLGASLALLCGSVARAETAPAPPAFDAGAPETWRLSARLPKGSAERESLIRDLMAPARNKHEAALTRAEAEAVLDDPRAELVYGERTVKIIAPSSVKRQNQQHVDLLKLYLKPHFLDTAAAFTLEHAQDLARAESKYKVDREVIVAILMFETRLGTITGDFHAFNVFTSQAFFIDQANALALAQAGEKNVLATDKQAARVERIRKRAISNLLALVRMGKARNMDALAIKGSWAGALGFPQFMPASLIWAADGDGDGKVDLFTFPDAIASVGSYLSAHGFEKDRKKAVWGYNHESAYVDGVLGFASALSAQLAAPPVVGAATNEGATKPAIAPPQSQ